MQRSAPASGQLLIRREQKDFPRRGNHRIRVLCWLALEEAERSSRRDQKPPARVRPCARTALPGLWNRLLHRLARQRVPSHLFPAALR